MLYDIHRCLCRNPLSISDLRFPIYSFTTHDAMSSFDLIQKCREGDVNGVRSLIADRANVNMFIDGESPLSVAARNKNIDILDVLLQDGADPTSFFGRQETPLMVASQLAHLEVAQHLLQHQPASPPNAPDDDSFTSLLLAITFNKLDVVSNLLDANVDVAVSRDDGLTPLMACRDVTLARRLLEMDVGIHRRSEGRKDALFCACSRGNVEMVSLLLERGANMYIRDWDRTTVLMRACSEGHTEVVNLLLQGKPQVGDATESAWLTWLHSHKKYSGTALHRAVKGGHVGCVQALINAGFDVNLQDGNRHKALDHVRTVEMARILLDAGAEYSPTAIASACKYPDRIDLFRLLFHSFPVPKSDILFLLIHASWSGNLEAVRMLLDFEPNRDVNERDSIGHTALDLCMDVRIARLLLARGANPLLVDKYGKTVLMKEGAVCARVLLEVAPDLVSMKDHNWLTAVMHHSQSISLYAGTALEELLRCCKEMGLDAGVNTRAIGGDTALFMAVNGGDPSKIKLLVENGADVLSCGRGDMTVLMRVLLSGGIDTYSRDNAGVDSEMKECLQIMLDAVLLRGGGGEAVTGVRKSAAETEDEPVAKRRKGRSV